MKKTLLKVLGGLCVATLAAGLTSCAFLPGGGGTSSSTDTNSNNNSSVVTPAVTYSLNTSKFEKTVVFGSALNLETLTLEASNGEKVAITSKMVSGWNTDSVGVKTLTVTAPDGEKYSVGYTVKYEVKFEVDGKIVSTQLVGLNETVTYPTETPEKEGFEFEKWSPENVETPTGNITIRAQFKGVELPETGTLTIAGDAVYVREFGESGQLSLNASFGVLASADFNVTLSNQNITVTKARNQILLTPVKAGVTTLKVTATDPATGELLEATKTIVVNPRSLMINEVKLGGSKIEEIFTLGGSETDGKAATYDFDVSYGEAGDIGEGLLEHIVWESSSNSVTVDDDGKVTLAQSGDTEMVALTAKFVVNDKTYTSSEAYTIRCVYDGVNVDSFDELYKETRATNPKPVILQKDVKDDFSNFAEGSGYEVINMYTTYDDTYYVNKYPDTYKDVATIQVLLQFKNDLYGNGYQINAHNAAYGLDGSDKLKGDALFRGPLNFVAMGAGEETGMLSVKAQDNVCFGLFEGVTINNVELRGCDLTAADNEYDLTDLTYTGTVAEVFGDDVTIEYSRITNGRTVLRIFGYDGDREDMKATNVMIKNSVLSGAREFILRIGSNYFVRDNNNASPYLKGDSNGSYLNVKKLGDGYYGNMSAADKKSYDDQFIKTFVIVKNSVFKDAGIFAVGMDSHFAGPALHDPESNSVIMGVLGNSAAYWKNLAKTSYGAKLTFEGDVRMYNWKPLEQIDSSTLIENLGPKGWKWDSLTFDVKKMVGEIAKTPGYETLIVSYDDTDDKITNPKAYVHAGIAFFGGGRNYSVVEDLRSDAEAFVGFNVSLQQVHQEMLITAAGSEDFYFMIYASTSSFTPEKQLNLFDENRNDPNGPNYQDPYACIKVK